MIIACRNVVHDVTSARVLTTALSRCEALPAVFCQRETYLQLRSVHLILYFYGKSSLISIYPSTLHPQQDATNSSKTESLCRCRRRSTYQHSFDLERSLPNPYSSSSSRTTATSLKHHKLNPCELSTISYTNHRHIQKPDWQCHEQH